MCNDLGINMRFRLTMYSFQSKSSIDGLVMVCYVCLLVRRGCPSWSIGKCVVCVMNVCWMSRSRCKFFSVDRHMYVYNQEHGKTMVRNYEKLEIGAHAMRIDNFCDVACIGPCLH